MQSFGDLFDKFKRFKAQHDKLAEGFNNFAKHIAEYQANNPRFNIDGIEINQKPAERCFDVVFAGRTLTFEFASILAEDGKPIGKVKCYLNKRIPESSLTEIGRFTFTPNSYTDIIDPEEQQKLSLDNDYCAMYIFLHFLDISYTK